MSRLTLTQPTLKKLNHMDFYFSVDGSRIRLYRQKY